MNEEQLKKLAAEAVEGITDSTLKRWAEIDGKKREEPKAEGRCENCIAWSRTLAKDSGQCRLNPPVVHSIAVMHSDGQLYPHVHTDSPYTDAETWCMQHRFHPEFDEMNDRWRDEFERPQGFKRGKPKG